LAPPKLESFQHHHQQQQVQDEGINPTIAWQMVRK
jgi:hypothetical protein